MRSGRLRLLTGITAVQATLSASYSNFSSYYAKTPRTISDRNVSNGTGVICGIGQSYEPEIWQGASGRLARSAFRATALARPSPVADRPDLPGQVQGVSSARSCAPCHNDSGHRFTVTRP